MATFQQWLNARSEIQKNYQALTPDQQAQYRAAWESGGASSAKALMSKFKSSSTQTESTTTGAYDDVYRWLDNHPVIKNNFQELNDTDKQTYLETFSKRGRKAAKKFLQTALNITTPKNATVELKEGVHAPTFTKYPSPTLITSPEDLEVPDYDYVSSIKSGSAANVAGIQMPSYTKTGSIQGGTLQRVGAVGMPDYQGADPTKQYTAAESDYSMVDPMSFAEEYGEFYRGEALKNLNLADQIALQQLNTELGGLTDYARGAAALKREETSIDNLFNQQQRLEQVRHAVPGVERDLSGQRTRATAYAEGRLPDEMEDRMMELNVRSRAADTSAATGIGAESVAGQKASTLMSAEQRMNLSQYGEQLLSQNMAARTDLYLAPTEYISAGQQISVMPSQSASVLSASALGQLNEQANISATTALGTKVNQEQFSASLSNDISQFNAAIKQDTDKFNSSLAEQQAQFQANMQTQISEFNAQMEAAENLSEAELQQRTDEFNANLSTQQEQFQAQLQESISTFNAQLAVNQNQFNASISQRTNEFNANLATQQNQFMTTLGQRAAEFNTTMEYNTNVANAGIENTFALGRFDYNVTYKGLISGMLNSRENTELQLRLAEKELAIYEESLAKQIALEEEKLNIMREQLEKSEQD